MKLVVASERRQRAHPDAVGEEDLGCAVNPGPPLEQLGPVDGHVVLEADQGAGKGDGAAQKDEHDKVGEQGSEPDNLEAERKKMEI
jgi:hypothetical protein